LYINYLVRGNLYKPNETLFHIDGSFNLGDTSYNGKAHLERNDALTRIELRRSIKLGKSATPNGYDFVYERKNNHGNNQHSYNIASHLSLQTPGRDNATKMFNLKADFTRTNDLVNATLHSALDFLILTRSPPVQEKIQLDYVRRSVRSSTQVRRLVSPEANLKIQVKTTSNVFNFLLDHRHRRSSEASKKGMIRFFMDSNFPYFAQFVCVSLIFQSQLDPISAVKGNIELISKLY
jgi:hypothetical protein